MARMPTDTRNVVTNVSAQGTASADYDRATFFLTAIRQAKTAPQAKALVEQIVTKISRVITDLESKGLKIDRGTFKSNYSSAPHYEYVKNKSKLAGYQTTYQLMFTSATLDMVSDVQDALTELKDVTVQDVAFGIKDTEVLKHAALEDAYKRVSSRFEAECKVLDKDPDDYEIISWNVHYNDGHGRVAKHVMNSSRAALGGAQGAPEMEIESGKADINVTLSVSYALTLP